ncbi:hypothetical protein HYDPIDRAFT_131543 [Hydnomerulius pinastri MD-312]|uniref:Flavin reductase like domain-containing protein n=1 Tax=Hydnomerulius pinastri MD-312 TaxID=994086 RepID=A0A0C9WGC4_9AGAM|nr:hypothetical protein HYDPIDRAFT_131543 [Hydnomerulius pinastri MD-312]
MLPTARRVTNRNAIKGFRSLNACASSSTEKTRKHLRELLRETAQSVAVVTSLLPLAESANGTGLKHARLHTEAAYHGATLSSFSSIALDPFPLIAFSLRIPSRMASALSLHTEGVKSLNAAHLVVNVLSAAQFHLAERFARPDLHPRPFGDSKLQWTQSEDGLPILSGALGALSCSLMKIGRFSRWKVVAGLRRSFSSHGYSVLNKFLHWRVKEMTAVFGRCPLSIIDASMLQFATYQSHNEWMGS